MVSLQEDGLPYKSIIVKFVRKEVGPDWITNMELANLEKKKMMKIYVNSKKLN